MDSLDRLEWDERLSVDIQEVDDLQKKMLALINVLVDMKDSKADAKDCSNMIAEINEYSRYYFSREEEMLKAAGYPEAMSHTKKHRQFIKTTINLRRQVAEDENNLTYETIKSLRDWLIHHIIEVDQQYVPFLRINRYLSENN